MALPKWITPGGSLGIVPELEYYEFILDAYDTTGGGLTFSLVSGRLPLGLQVIPTGKIQGIPVSELQGDTTVEYRFTIRAKNADRQVADRTFNISITNIAPPIITPKNVDLGTIFDGTLVDTQLQAIDPTPGAVLTWKLIKGELPLGVSLSANGRLTGYLQAVTAVGPSGIPNWDETSWDLHYTNKQLGWDFPVDLVTKNYNFTIEVSDGVNYDQSNYSLVVFPRQDLLVSNDFTDDPNRDRISADATTIRAEFDFTNLSIDNQQFVVSETEKHSPAIITTQLELGPSRQSSYFSFKFTAIDFDSDALKFGIPTRTGSGFDEVDIGFDTTRYSQSDLSIPSGLVIDENTGWLIGKLSPQLANRIVYDFEVVVYKRDYPIYETKKLFYLEVLGDLTDTIIWVTPADLGTIENGTISELTVQAKSTTGKSVYYCLTVNGKKRLPQGLTLNPNGLIYGRVSFELFTFDSGTTTIDKEKTVFDAVYQFSVTACDVDKVLSAEQTFTIRVLKRNNAPYENLYLKASPSRYQRELFLDIVNDHELFDPAVIYRSNDPYFGIAKDIKFLFLPGLESNLLSTYIQAVSTNHFNKRLILGDLKTAVALDENFNVKYEVIYLEVLDTASTTTKASAKNQINLTGTIKNPYYDSNGQDYTIAYPNGFNNMRDAIESNISYKNKGALPAWMTSNQVNSSNPSQFTAPLGLTHGVVLAYTIPGASKKIVYKLKLHNLKFNEIDFSVDRYLLDNIYSKNYNISQRKYLTSNETTFDRLYGPGEQFTDKGMVDYAVSISFDLINGYYVDDIRSYGGLDGILNFNDGDLIVFAQQEFPFPINKNGQNQQYIPSGDFYDHLAFDMVPYDELTANIQDPTITIPQVPVVGQKIDHFDVFGLDFMPFDQGVTNDVAVDKSIISRFDQYAFDQYPYDQFDPSLIAAAPVDFTNDYNHGWNSQVIVWDEDPWAVKPNKSDEPWDESGYIPGYKEYIDLAVLNKRAGIWRINISETQLVSLSFVSAMNYYDLVTVRNGFTYAGVSIYFNPTIGINHQVPAYSQLPRQLTVIPTTFDGNGTRFLSNRDMSVLPEDGDKYIKYVKLGVFT